jgi:hypothetical protein
MAVPLSAGFVGNNAALVLSGTSSNKSSKHLGQQGFDGPRRLFRIAVAQQTATCYHSWTCAEFWPKPTILQWRKSSKRLCISRSCLMTESAMSSCTIAFDSCYFLAHANCGAISGRRTPRGIAERASFARIGRHCLADNDCPWRSTIFSGHAAVTLTQTGVSSRADEHERKTHVLGHR